MTQREMFEKSFERPTNFLTLSTSEQWEIDKKLGILDWDGENLNKEDIERTESHYIKVKKKVI
jgi:hypothetical protein